MLAVAKKKPTVTVYMRLPKVVKELMDELAEEQRRPVTEQISIALEEHLKKHGKWPPADSDD